MNVWGTNLAVAIAALAALALILEGALALLPTADPPVLMAGTGDRNLAYRPYTRFTWSKGPNFDSPNKGRTNGQGFVADIDYGKSDGPILAVIGDSYVEAMVVPWSESLVGRLNADGPAYGYGISGSPLSQYLAFAERARDSVAPKAFVFVIIRNDFDQSVPPHTLANYYRRFSAEDFAILLGQPKQSTMQSLLRYSALIRYLVFNMELPAIWARVVARIEGTHHSTETRLAAQMRNGNGLRAIDVFLDHLSAATGVSPDKILILTDGERQAIYHPALRDTVQSSYVWKAMAKMREKAAAAGFEVIDMHPHFAADYAAQGRRFEFANDWHWSAYGHGVVAKAIKASQIYQTLRSAPILP